MLITMEHITTQRGCSLLSCTSKYIVTYVNETILRSLRLYEKRFLGPWHRCC